MARGDGDYVCFEIQAGYIKTIASVLLGFGGKSPPPPLEYRKPNPLTIKQLSETE